MMARSDSEIVLVELNEGIKTIENEIQLYVAENINVLSNSFESGTRTECVKTLLDRVNDVDSVIQGIKRTIQKQKAELQETMENIDYYRQRKKTFADVERFQVLYEAVGGWHQTKSSILNVENAKIILELERIVEKLNVQEELQVHKVQVQKYGQSMRQEALRSLVHGMEASSRDEMALAMQMLHVFGKLQGCVRATVVDTLEELENKLNSECTKFAKNVRGHRKAKEGEIQNYTWRLVQLTIQIVQKSSFTIWNMQSVLYSLMNHQEANIDVEKLTTDDFPGVFDGEYWKRICKVLENALKNMMLVSKEVLHALCTLYPKICEYGQACILELDEKTKVQMDASSHAMDDKIYFLEKGHSTMEWEVLLNALSPILLEIKRDIYEKLTTPIELMFPHQDDFHASLPSAADIKEFIKVINTEFDTANKEFQRVESLTSQLMHAVQLLCRRAETMANTTKHTIAPPFTRTEAQNHNIQLVQLLMPLELTIKSKKFQQEKIENRTSTSIQHLTKSLATISELINDIIGPYFVAIAQYVERIIFDQAAELATFREVVEKLVKMHLHPCPRSSTVNDCKQQLVERLLFCLAYYISISKPNLEIASYVSILEQIAPVQKDGKGYEELVTLKELTQLDPVAMLRSPKVDKVRPCLVWYYLISNIPDGFPSPHEIHKCTRWEYYTTKVIDNEGPIGTQRSVHDQIQSQKRLWQDIVDCHHNATCPPAVKDNIEEAGDLLLIGYQLMLEA